MAEAGVARKRSKIAENTVFLALSGAGGALFTLVQLAILSRFLDTNLFGFFVVLRGFSLLLATIILAGLPQVLIRYIPSYESRGERGKATFMFLASTIVVIVLAVLIFSLSRSWTGWMPSSLRNLHPSGDVIFWMAIASVTLALKMLLYGGFNGLREMRIQMILELTYLAALTVFIAIQRNALDVALLFKAICVLNAIVFISGLPVFFLFVRRLIPTIQVSKDEGIILPRILPYWIGSILLGFVALAFTDVDRFVMASVLPVAAISIFHVASRINGLLKKFLAIPLIAAQPEITRIYEDGRIDELVGKIRLFTKGTFVASCFVSGIIAIAGRDIIAVLSGPVYRDSYQLLLLLLVAIPFAAIAAPLLTTMRSLHYIRWAIVCDFLWMVVYFGTFFLFVPVIGITAIALAHLIAAVTQMFAAVVISKREGFFAGPVSRLGRVIVMYLIVVPAGIVFTAKLGIWASLVCVVLSPIFGKLFLERLDIFDASEKMQIIDLIPVPAGRRAVRWMLFMEE